MGAKRRREERLLLTDELIPYPTSITPFSDSDSDVEIPKKRQRTCKTAPLKHFPRASVYDLTAIPDGKASDVRILTTPASEGAGRVSQSPSPVTSAHQDLEDGPTPRPILEIPFPYPTPEHPRFVPINPETRMRQEQQQRQQAPLPPLQQIAQEAFTHGPRFHNLHGLYRPGHYDGSLDDQILLQLRYYGYPTCRDAGRYRYGHAQQHYRQHRYPGSTYIHGYHHQYGQYPVQQQQHYQHPAYSQEHQQNIRYFQDAMRQQHQQGYYRLPAYAQNTRQHAQCDNEDAIRHHNYYQSPAGNRENRQHTQFNEDVMRHYQQQHRYYQYSTYNDERQRDQENNTAGRQQKKHYMNSAYREGQRLDQRDNVAARPHQEDENQAYRKEERFIQHGDGTIRLQQVYYQNPEYRGELEQIQQDEAAEQQHHYYQSPAQQEDEGRSSRESKYGLVYPPPGIHPPAPQSASSAHSMEGEDQGTEGGEAVSVTPIRKYGWDAVIERMHSIADKLSAMREAEEEEVAAGVCY